MESLGILFPFEETIEGGVIATTKSTAEAIKSDLTAFLLLKRGQRVMRNNMYSPIFDYIMEPWDEISESALREALEEKIGEFFKEIQLNAILFVFYEENNLLEIKIAYTIIGLAQRDGLILNVPLQN